MKKTVKWMGSIAVVCMSVLGLTGCSSLSSIPNNVAPGVANKTGVVQVSSSCLNAEYPKTFYVVADKAVKNSPYLEEVKAYTVNGLKYIGMTEAAGESDRDDQFQQHPGQPDGGALFDERRGKGQNLLDGQCELFDPPRRHPELPARTGRRRDAERRRGPRRIGHEPAQVSAVCESGDGKSGVILFCFQT